MLWFILGYVLAVLFPIYGLNAIIVSMWAKIGVALAGYLKTPATSTPTSPVPTSPGVTVPVTVPPPSSQRVNQTDHPRAF